MAVPEKRHFFQQRRRRRCDPFQPPRTQIEQLIAFQFARLAHLEIVATLFSQVCLHPDCAQVARMGPFRRGGIVGGRSYLN